MADSLSWITLILSGFSLLGSSLIIVSYYVARTKTQPKAAILIRNLAIADFVWFICSLINAFFWVTNSPIPKYLCYFISPLINFTRMASLIWTCVISFNVLITIEKRKWGYIDENQIWYEYRIYYYLALILLALPGALINAIKQYQPGNNNLGCDSGYERLGDWWEIFLTEILPICIGFFYNKHLI